MRLSLKNLLMALFGLLVVLAFTQGAVSYWSLRTIRERANEITANWMPSLDIIAQFQGILAEDRLAGYRFLTAGTEAGRAEALQRDARAEARLRELEAAYQPLITSPEERALYDAYQAKRTQMRAVWERCADLARTDAQAALTLFRGQHREFYDAAVEFLSQDAALNKRGAANAIKGAEEAEARALLATCLALGLAAACGLGAMTVTALRVMRPLDRMTAVMTTLATGDTAAAVPDRQRRDEIVR